MGGTGRRMWGIAPHPDASDLPHVRATRFFLDGRGGPMGDPVRVSVIALDPMLEAGATSALLGRPGVAVVPPDDGADVTVVVVDGISDRVFDLVRERRDRPGRPEVVLVATDFAASEALHAIAVAAGLRLIADGRETDEIARGVAE